MFPSKTSSASKVAGTRFGCYSSKHVVCSIFKNLFVFLFTCMYICLCRCIPSVGGYLQSLEGDVRYPGTGVVGNCQPLDMCAGNQTLVLAMSSKDS